MVAGAGPLLKHNFAVGLTIPGGGLWFAQQRGGLTAVMELLYGATPMAADRARELRLVNEVVPGPPAAVLDRARAVAAMMAALSGARTRWRGPRLDVLRCRLPS